MTAGVKQQHDPLRMRSAEQPHARCSQGWEPPEAAGPGKPSDAARYTTASAAQAADRAVGVGGRVRMGAGPG